MKRQTFAFVRTALVVGSAFLLDSVFGGVAKIGDTDYATLEAALAEAVTGQTIVLQDDCTLTAGQTLSRSFTLDLNSHAVTVVKSPDANASAFQPSLSVTFTVRNGSVTVPSTVGSFFIDASATKSKVVMDRVTIDHAGSQACVQTWDGVEMNRCTVSSHSSYAVRLQSCDGTLTDSNFFLTEPVDGSRLLALAGATANVMTLTACSVKNLGTCGKILDMSTGGRVVFKDCGEVSGLLSLTQPKQWKSSSKKLSNPSCAAVELDGGKFDVSFNWQTCNDTDESKEKNYADNHFLLKKGKFSACPPEDPYIKFGEGASRPTAKTGDWWIVGNVPEEVCSIGSRVFESLTAAFEALEEGDTITLLQNATLADNVSIPKTYTIDFGGFTLSAPDVSGAAFTQDGARTLTLKNGTFVGGEDCAWFARAIASKARITVENMRVELEEDMPMFQYYNGGDIFVRDGVYSSDPSLFVDDDCEVTTEPDAKLGRDVWKVTSHQAAPKVAEIVSADGTHTRRFENLDDALAVLQPGDTVNVLENCTMSAPVVAGFTFTLSLGGKTVTGTMTSGWYFTTPEPTATVTIRNGTFAAAGTGAFGFLKATKGSVVLQDVSLEFGGSAAAVDVGLTASLSVQGGRIAATEDRTAPLVSVDGAAAVCTFSRTTEIDAAAVATGVAIESKGAQIALTGGTYLGSFRQAAAGEIVVSGGTYSFKPTSYLKDGYMVSKDGSRFVVGQIVARLTTAQDYVCNFTNLDEAVAGLSDGATVKVMADCKLTKSLTLPNASFTIDFGGKKVTGDSTFGYWKAYFMTDDTTASATPPTLVFSNGTFEVTGCDHILFAEKVNVLLKDLDFTMKGGDAGSRPPFELAGTSTHSVTGIIENCRMVAERDLVRDFIVAYNGATWIVRGEDTLISAPNWNWCRMHYSTLGAHRGTIVLEGGTVIGGQHAVIAGLSNYSGIFRMTGGEVKLAGAADANSCTIYVRNPGMSGSGPLSAAYISDGRVHGVIRRECEEDGEDSKSEKVEITGGCYDFNPTTKGFVPSGVGVKPHEGLYYVGNTPVPTDGPEAETPSGQKMTVQEKSPGVYEIKVDDPDVSELTVSGLQATDKVEIPAQVSTVKGVATSGQLVVKTVKDVDITSVVRLSQAGDVVTVGELVEKDATGAYTTVEVTTATGTETVRVNPEIDQVTVAEEVVEPVTESAVGIHSIPGLTYQLMACETLTGTPTAAGDPVVADGTTMKLEVDPAKFASSTGSAFFRVVVTK